MTPKYLRKHSEGSGKRPRLSCTSQGLSTELQRNGAARGKGKLAAMAPYVWTPSRFSQFLPKRKSFISEISTDATLLSVKRKMKSAKWTNYGKESLCNYWSNLFSLSQLDTVKILHNISKELTQFVSKLFTEDYSQEITFNEQGYV